MPNMTPHADSAVDSQTAAVEEVHLDVEPLLRLTARDLQVDWLREHGLLTHAGLETVLDEAEQAVGRDPGQARRLAELCDALAGHIDAGSDLHARATYICAQTHYRNAEFDAALKLIDEAHAAYLAIGNAFEALRVNLGRIAVLSEQGDYTAALETGRNLIERAGALQPDARFDVTQEDIAQLLAKTWLNCGACHELKGDYDAALQAFAQAEARYVELGLDEFAADIQLNRGVVFLKLGLSAPALAAFEDAHRRFGAAGQTLKDAWALINAADAHLMLGNYTQSLQWFAEARRNIEPLEASADKHVLLLDAADAYLDLNLFAEASTACREAIAALRASGMTHDLARAHLSLGTALMGQADYGAAEPSLSEAAQIFRQGGNIPMQVWVLLQQSALQRQQGHIDDALHLAHQAMNLAEQGAWPMQQVEAQLALAELSLPDTERAKPYLMRAKPMVEQLGLPNVGVRLNALLGRWHLLREEYDQAEAYLQAAVRETEHLRGGLASDRMRASFVDSRLSPYEDLIELYLRQPERHGISQAFEMAERAKSRVLVDRLSAGQALPQHDQPALQRTRQLQRELEACYTAMMSADVGVDDAMAEGEPASEPAGEPMDDVPALQQRALAIEQEINQLEMAASTHADHVGIGSSLTLEAIQAQMPVGAVLVSYISRGDEIIAFVGTPGRLDVVREVGRISAVQAHLQQLDLQWQRLRADANTVARHLPQLTRATQTVLRALFAELIERVAPLLKGQPGTDTQARPLIIVPHGPLHHVPFHALFDGQRYLIDDFEISYAPSGTVFAQCQQRASVQTGRALVVGVADPLIPAAVEEATALAQGFDHVTLLTGADATVSAVQLNAHGCDTVHVACHGLFRADNPMFSSLRLYDGWLMAADIARIDLNGAHVTFSACESGRNQVMRGDEVYGLVRAALSGGAASVVASLWLVHDQTTATLMQAWYGLQKQGMSRAKALWQAQRQIRLTQPHPYFWAPFVLIGNR